jgi:transposase
MKPYPLELRQRIVDAVNQTTEPIADIAVTFGVSERYVYKLLALQRNGESLQPKVHGGGAQPKIVERHRRTLEQLIAEQPDATLEELRDRLHKRHRLRVSINTVWRAIDALDITVKKKLVARVKPQ